MKLLIVTNSDGDTTGMYKVTPEMIDKIKQLKKDLEVISILSSDSELEKKLLEADILISNDLSILTSENSQNLKWVHLTSAGTNKLPDYIKNSEIIITNSSGVHPIPIAEHVFGLMLMLSRKIHLAHKFQITKRTWVRNYGIYQPGELFGKTLIIVGMGRIGERIARLAGYFGMEVFGIVRDLNKKRSGHIKLFGIEDLSSLVKEADFVVNCLPGIPTTVGVFDNKLFKRFKKGSFFINIGRGTTVVEQDLIKALSQGILSGAGLDVFEIEPLPESSPLWKMENVIITPHYSGWTPKYTERVMDIFIENLKAYLKKEPCRKTCPTRNTDSRSQLQTAENLH